MCKVFSSHLDLDDVIFKATQKISGEKKTPGRILTVNFKTMMLPVLRRTELLVYEV